MRSITQRVWRCLLAAALAFAAVPSAASGSPAPQIAPRALTKAVHGTLPGRLLVRFRDDSAESLAAFSSRHALGKGAVKSGHRGRPVGVSVPPGRSDAAFLAELRADPNVVYAEPVLLRQVSAYVPPNDPAYNDPAADADSGTSAPYAKSWWLRGSGLNAAAAWQHGFSDPSARDFPVRAPSAAFKVGVVDTGFYMTHPDKGANIVAGWDYFQSYDGVTGTYTEDGDVTPPPTNAVGSDVYVSSHGSCTAGEIAAATNNGEGVASAGYDAQVRVYKVAGRVYHKPGYASGEVAIFSESMMAGIYGAADDGCKVISISLGGPDFSQAEQDACTYAWSKGCVIVAATGNDGWSGVQYPARYDHVVGVGASGVSGGVRHRTSFTDYGPGLDILAPGDLVYGLFKPDQTQDWGGTPAGPPGYAYWAGTSMATPAAAGAIAHLWRYVPFLSNDGIAELVERTASPAGGGRPNTSYGWGYLDMSSAMTSITATYAYLGAPTLHVPAAPVPGDYTVTWDAVPGHAVEYAVSLDGSIVTTTASTSATITVGAGTHTVGAQATSALDYYDDSSLATATMIVASGGPPVPTDCWGDPQPSGWSTTQSPVVSVRARDVTSGLLPNTADFRWTTDGGAHWSAWTSGTLDCLPTSTSTETLSARVPFGADSATLDEVQFRVTNGASLVGTSPAFPIRVDSTPPSGTMTAPPEVSTTALGITSAVTDANAIEMRLSGDAGATWSPWRPYAAEATVTLSGGRGAKTAEAQYRDEAGNTITRSAGVFLAVPPELTRLEGPNRYETALRISRQHFSHSGEVVIATGADFADALSASALAGSYGAPLLLTTPQTLYPGIAEEIARLGAGHVFVIGSSKAVSSSAYTQLATLDGITVTRLWGADRYATSAAVAGAVVSHERALGHTLPAAYFLARGDDFADALSASPVAYARRMPIVLTRPSSAPAATWSAIRAVDPSKTATAVIAGSTTAVGTAVTAGLDADGRKWERVSGPNRYGTSAGIAEYASERGWASWGLVGIATGANFPDALGGGVATGASGGVMLLTPPRSLAPPASASVAAHAHDVRRIEVFGGASAVSPSVASALSAIF